MVTTVKRLLAVALLAASACSANFPPQYRVTDLRILAVRSLVDGTPAVADGDPPDTLVLSALVANPQARPGLRIVWRACLPTSAEACLRPEALRDPGSLDGKDGVIGPVEGATVRVSLDVPEVRDSMAALVSLVELDHSVGCHFYLELPVVVTAEAGGRRETAIKTVRLDPLREAAGTSVAAIADEYLLNLNPGIQALRLDPTDSNQCDGTDVARVCDSSCTTGICTPDGDGGLAQCLPAPGAVPAGKHVLCGLQQDSAAQRYRRCDASNDPFTAPKLAESLSWQWYVTDGTIDNTSGVGNATGHHVTLARPAGPFTLWLILRDNRGGVSWIQRDFPAAQ
jgi:hypothetical protein